MSRTKETRVVTLESASKALYVTHGRDRGMAEAERRMLIERTRGNDGAERFWQAVVKLISLEAE